MSSLKPFAKAIAPAVVTLLAAVVYSLQAGKVDTQSILIAAVGVASSAITYFVPNAAPEVQVVDAALANYTPAGNYAPASGLKPEQPAQPPVAQADAAVIASTPPAA